MFGSFGCAYVCSVTSSSFSTLWTVAHQTPLSWDFSGKNTGVGCQISSSGWFPWSRDRTCVSQVSLHCRRILSLLSHGGSWFVKLGVLNAFFILMFQFYILPSDETVHFTILYNILVSIVPILAWMLAHKVIMSHLNFVVSEVCTQCYGTLSKLLFILYSDVQ